MSYNDSVYDLDFHGHKKNKDVRFTYVSRYEHPEFGTMYRLIKDCECSPVIGIRTEEITANESFIRKYTDKIRNIKIEKGEITPTDGTFDDYEKAEENIVIIHKIESDASNNIIGYIVYDTKLKKFVYMSDAYIYVAVQNGANLVGASVDIDDEFNAHVKTIRTGHIKLKFADRHFNHHKVKFESRTKFIAHSRKFVITNRDNLEYVSFESAENLDDLAIIGSHILGIPVNIEYCGINSGITIFDYNTMYRSVMESRMMSYISGYTNTQIVTKRGLKGAVTKYKGITKNIPLLLFVK